MIKSVIISLCFFSLILISWEMATQSYESLRFILPAPSKISSIIWHHADRFYFHTQVTLYEMAGGFFLALIAAFPLAWIMVHFKHVSAILQPIFVMTQCVPMIALAPIAVFWFGWSYTAIIVPTAIMVFFPLTINIYEGLGNAPKAMMDFFRLHQATPWQTFYKLQLPWAVPNIFTGFKIGMAYAGIGAVAGEWAGGQDGLGILMLESRRAADMPMMFGALFCLTCLSLACYGVVVYWGDRIGNKQKRLVPKGVFQAIALSVLLTSTGCQFSNADVNKTNETTLVLDWLPNPDHVPLYVGLEKGFFLNQGINLKILKIAEPSDNVPFIASGQASLGLSYMSSTLLALSHDTPLVPIGILIDTPLNAFIYKSDSGIKEPKDLNGKVIGYCVDGYHTKYLETILSLSSVVPKKMCNASFDLVGMLATNQVDAIFGAYWNIEGENLRSHGIETEYFPLSHFGVPSHYELIILAMQGSQESTPEFIQSFQIAMQESIDFSKNHPQEAFKIYLQANPDKSDSTRKWEELSWYKTMPVLAKSQVIDPKVWNDFVNWLISKDLLPENSKSTTLIK